MDFDIFESLLTISFCRLASLQTDSSSLNRLISENSELMKRLELFYLLFENRGTSCLKLTMSLVNESCMFKRIV